MKKAVLFICVLCILGAAAYMIFGEMRGGDTGGEDNSPSLQAENPSEGEGKPREQAPEGPHGPPAEPAEGDIARLIAEGDSLAEAGGIEGARKKYSEALKRIILEGEPVADRAAVLDTLCDKLRPLNRIIYGDVSRVFDGQSYYRVDDLLSRIAGKYRITYQYLAKLNGIPNPNVVRAGRKIKVVHGPFHAVVDLSDRRLYVFHGEYYYKDYPVSVGKAGRQTPADRYVVGDKMSDGMSTFSWTDPDTGEVFRPGDAGFMLGTRWIKLVGDRVGDTSIGIHGRSAADNDKPLGEAVSRGCIRMRNRDVEELYDLLVPRYSRVIVRE